MWTAGRSHGQGIPDWPRSSGSKAQAVFRLSLHGTRTLEDSKQQKSQSLEIPHLASTYLFKSRVPIGKARVGNLRHRTRAFGTGPGGKTTHVRLSHQDRVVEPPASKVSRGTAGNTFPFGTVAHRFRSVSRECEPVHSMMETPGYVEANVVSTHYR